jgi:DedD protein
MEDRGLRDIDRWREKIEVRLDNRQVFFLFFGSALVACLLFVLGVIVGKRLESRGRAEAPEIEDPLALLDKVAAAPRTPPAGVTFPQELFAGASKSDRTAKKTVASLGRLEDPAKAVAQAPAAAVNKAEPAPAPALAKVVDKPSPAKVPAPKPVPAPAVAEPIAIPTIVAGQDTKSKGRFTLQISSFQDKKEAENFARTLAGQNPYLVQSDIPEKGIWYRVRVGSYASDKDANAAKLAFERKFNLIAYVARR